MADKGLIKKVNSGGFVETNVDFLGMKPVEIKRVSDNEVYGLYPDPTDSSVLWKQTIKAEGEGDTRRNFTAEYEVYQRGKS